MRKLVIAMALLAAPSLAFAQGAQDSLTLAQVVERALAASPDIVSATSSVNTAGSAERVAWGAFLPSLSLTSGASLSSTERFNPTTNTTVTGSSDSYSAGLSSSLDIFTGGRRGAEMKRANAATDLAEATLTERKFAVTLAARQAYFDLAKAGELRAVAQARLQRADEGLSAAQRRLQVGTATRSDVLRAQLEQNNAKQAVASATFNEKTLAFALARLVGSNVPVYARAYTQPAPRPI
ncbi:MAG TPA: TolC family protein, partial [Longimicrobiales bacterium]